MVDSTEPTPRGTGKIDSLFFRVATARPGRRIIDLGSAKSGPGQLPIMIGLVLNKVKPRTVQAVFSGGHRSLRALVTPSANVNNGLHVSSPGNVVSGCPGTDHEDVGDDTVVLRRTTVEYRTVGRIPDSFYACLPADQTKRGSFAALVGTPATRKGGLLLPWNSRW
jgi:hypothetical protein